MFQRSLIAGLLVCALQSCDRPECKNTNPVFDKYTPDQKIYKQELARLLNKVNRDELGYWIDKHAEKDGKILMSIFIQGDGICARGIVDITNVPDGDKLKTYQMSTGGGYRGAGLNGFKYRIDTTNDACTLIYEHVDKIVD